MHKENIKMKMTPADKLKFLIKKFGVALVAEYLDASKTIDIAFKNALYAEHVVNQALKRTCIKI